MNKIILRGIAPGSQNDDRTVLIVDIHYNDEIFPWELRMPPTYTMNWDDYIDSNSDKLFLELETKLTEWENLDPKFTEIEDPMGMTSSVEITREDWVKPTYPDYYALRFREYPSLSEQLDSFWKGDDAIESMRDKIAEIKEKYPKN